MWIITIFRYVFGFVNVGFSGDYCERLLNICAKNHIALWNIKRIKENIFVNISVRNFKKLRKLRGKSCVHIKIYEKHGLPFVFKKYKIRWGVPIGICIFFAILIYMGNYVWQIYVVGNVKISEKTILEAGESIGIKIGVSAKEINTLKNKEELLLSVNGIAWASLNLEGSRLTININETIDNDKTDNLPSNIYAKTDCVIKKIDIKSGIPLVKKGDAVLKGDLLVTGIIDLPNAQIKEFVKSNAIIIGETNRTFTTKVYKENYILINKEIKHRKTLINFFGLNLPLYFGNVNPPYCFDTINKNLNLFGKKLPIGYKTKIFQEYEYKKINIDFESAKKIAYERIENAMIEGNYNTFYQLNEEFFEEKDFFILQRKYKCEENIGYEEKISENNLK